MLILCTFSHPPPLPLDMSPGQSCHHQSECVPSDSVGRYHTHLTFEPYTQENMTTWKNDLENHLEDSELVSYFLCIKNSETICIFFHEDIDMCSFPLVKKKLYFRVDAYLYVVARSHPYLMFPW